jgi:hypothetical protein
MSLHHGHLHLQQISCSCVNSVRNDKLWQLWNMCGSVFVDVVGVVAVDVVFAAVDVLVELFVFCHPDRRGCYFSLLVPQQGWGSL